MNWHRFTVCLALIACISGAWAQPKPPGLISNGCGSGRFSFIVPDGTVISQCNFLAACNSHDLCYGKCLEGGAKYGNADCNIAQDKKRRREVCDVSLRQDILTLNPGKPICGMYAALYRFAVQKLGEEYFHGLGGTGVALPLKEFLDFVETNPRSFEPADVEKAFDSITNSGLEDPKYTVIFLPQIPRLRVLHNQQVVVDVLGKGTSE